MKPEPLKVTHTLTHKSAYPKNPKSGDLLVYHFFERCMDGQTTHLYPVKSPDEAIELINKLANEQVNDDEIGFNIFDLLVFNQGATIIGGADDWEDWYSPEYETITEYAERQKTNTIH